MGRRWQDPDQLSTRRGVYFTSYPLAYFPAHGTHAPAENCSGGVGAAGSPVGTHTAVVSSTPGGTPAELQWDYRRRARSGSALLSTARGSRGRDLSRSSRQRSGAFASVVGALQERAAGAGAGRWLDGARRRLQRATAGGGIANQAEQHPVR